MSDNFHTHPKSGTFTHYPTDFELLEAAEAHIKRLAAENQYQANLLGNAYGAIADWTDLPSDTRPAKAIEHLGREVERLSDEIDTRRVELADWVDKYRGLEDEVERLIDTITELRRKLAEGQDAHRFWSDAALLAAVKLTQAEARENALRAIPDAVRAAHSQPMQTHQAIDKINELMGEIE